MSVSGGFTGATNNGTSAVAYTKPSGGTADSGWLCIVGWGGPSPYTPPSTATSGWSLIGSFNGGSGATYNNNVGNRGVAAFWATGSAPADPTIDLTGANCVQVGRIVRFEKTLANWAAPTFRGVADSSSGTTFSGTFGSDPGAVAGDMAVLLASWVDRTATPSSPSINWPGMTVATPDQEMSTATALGRAARLVAYSSELTGGPSSGAPSFSITASAAVTGAAGMLNLHDYSSGPSVGAFVGGVFVPAASYGIWNGSSFVPAASITVK